MYIDVWLPPDAVCSTAADDAIAETLTPGSDADMRLICALVEEEEDDDVLCDAPDGLPESWYRFD